MKKFLLTLAAIGSFSAVQAQQAGSWLIQGGATRIAPDVSSGALSAPAPSGTTVDVGANSQPTAQITYVYDNNWAVAVPLGLGFQHKLYGTGSIAGVGQIGTVTALPVSIFAQYRWGQSDAKFRPYAMLGLSYVYFHDAKGSAALNSLNPLNPMGGSTGLKVDSKFALSPGLGIAYQWDERWFLDFSYAKSLLKTTTTLSTGQTISTRLDPAIFTVGVGVRF